MNDSINEDTDSLQNIIVDIVEISLFPLIFLLAVAYTILILTRKIFRLNKLNWPTVNVCLATALFSLIQLIFTIIRLKNLSIMSCRLQGFILNISACQMMYAYCVSSINRLLAIRYFNKPVFRSTRWLLINISIGWIVGLLFAIPNAFYDSFTCFTSTSPMLLKVYTCITTLIIPVHIVAVCNVSIFRYINQASRRVHSISNNINNHRISRKRDTYVSKLMLLTFCLFVIGWTPIFVEQLFTAAESRLPKGVSLFFQLLLLNSLLGDMILLIYANQPVRQLIKETLKCNGRIPCIIKC